ncbi:hypothetical protein JANAI62_17530 [Jannaschia pagri]|uniref:Uncharacterized protein n=1 Tax=Jannaschia pagri TaxID=2829797 RepID=A0ABQ4NLL9_9RHOB|nr:MULTISPECIES: hypothetical protein [unclassified Jannaschia]GIT91297.1 hypothetical protein JANAI61_17550 [Jannaschia sp. AI_61]GIT95130.1 hypothetical protein JANAI62_17530 [Jannaschia sp. AI_62]
MTLTPDIVQRKVQRTLREPQGRSSERGTARPAKGPLGLSTAVCAAPRRTALALSLVAVTGLGACNFHNAGTAPTNIPDGNWTANYTPQGAPYRPESEED